MSFNLLQTLKATVSPVALEQETEDILYKKQALTEFYPILILIVSAKPELFDKLNNCISPQIVDLFDEDEKITQQFLNYLSGEASTEQTKNVMNKSIAPTLNFLVSEAGSNDIQVILHAIKNHRDYIVQALPHWASDLLRLLGIEVEAKKMVEYLPDYSYRKYRKSNIFQWVLMVVLSCTLVLLVNASINDKFETEPQIIHLETTVNGHADH